MKYIFVAGAPGSKWSGVVKNIYYSPSINHSDQRDEWVYHKTDIDKIELMHFGAYFDPGMECDIPEYINTLDKTNLEKIFDKPFMKNNEGIKIIKSHVFCYEENITFIRNNWPDCHIVLVYRNDDSCFEWWVKAGHFNIPYPNYKNYYKDFNTMKKNIARQNKGILSSIEKYRPISVSNNIELATALNIENPVGYHQPYPDNDIQVSVLLKNLTFG